MLSPQSPKAILWIHGQGGVGKTSLMARLRDDAIAAGYAVLALDARDLQPEPQAFFAAMADALHVPSADAVADRLAGTPHVITLDTYEILDALDSWLRNDLVPSLPETIRLIIASRQPPAPWQRDPGLAGLIEVLALGNLPLEHARELLVRRGVPASQHDALCEATHGHPLALALVADMAANKTSSTFRLADAPDVVAALVENLVRTLPGPLHRQALFLAAEAHTTNENLLREVFGASEAAALYEWLRGLSIIETGARGLVPHELARDALSAEGMMRDREAVVQLHRVTTQWLLRQIDATQDEQERTRWVLEWLYLHRHNDTVREVLDCRRLGVIRAQTYSAADHDDVLALVTARTNPAVASVVSAWIAFIPAGIAVYRSAEGEVEGCAGVFELDLEQLGSAAGFDPFAALLLAQVQQRRWLVAGERVHIARFFVHRASGVLARPALNELQARLVARWIMPPPLTMSFVVLHAAGRTLGREQDHRWHRINAYADHTRVQELGFPLGSAEYEVLGHDWRKTPRSAWLELMARRELTGAVSPYQEHGPGSARQTPSREDFRQAVRLALRDYTREGEVLARSPLRRLCLPASDRGDGRAVRALLLDAAKSLKEHPRDSKLFRALDVTYLSPAPTQEGAAERLGLPFSTYRRHLAAAVNRVADQLWFRCSAGPGVALDGRIPVERAE